MFGQYSCVRRASRLRGWCEGCGRVPADLIRIKVGAQVLQACEVCWDELARLKRRLINEGLDAVEGK